MGTLSSAQYFMFLSIFIINDVFGFTLDMDQQFAMEPQDQVAVVGAKVILPCRVINKSGVLQWTKDDFGLGTRRKLTGFERYSMIGSDEEGDFSLQIYPVIMEDNAVFQCQVSPGSDGSPGVRSRYATLTVLVSPEEPVIVQGKILVTTEDREVTIECISANGKPAAEITWIDNFGAIFTTGVQYIVENSDHRRFTAKSILKFKATKEHHNKTIICQAHNSVDVAYRTAQVNLEVKYAPKVIVAIIEGALDARRIPEGNLVVMLCDVDANPNDVVYRWYINDEPFGQHLKELTLFNVTREYQGSIVKCAVQNSVGLTSDSQVLDIIYQPTFKTRPGNVEADDQEVVYLDCEIDSNPPAEIVWVFDPIDRINFHPRVVGTTSKLEIVASEETAGRYYCKAASVGFPEIKSEAKVFLKGPPKILSSSEQYHSGNVNDSFEIECVAVAIPKAKHVSWAYNGKLIDFDQDEIFSMREFYLADGIRSTVTIEENQMNYFGKYTCTVINSYGVDSLEILYNEPNQFSPVVAIAGSALIFVIFLSGSALILYCVRTNKQQRTTLPPADIIPKENGNTKCVRRNGKILTKNELSEQQEYQESNSGSYSTTTTLSINKTDLISGRSANLSIPVCTRYSGNYTDNLSIHTNQSISGIGGICNGSGIPINMGNGGNGIGGIGGIGLSGGGSIIGVGAVGSASYVDYARDYYSPTIQNANNCLLQLQRETPTYV